MNSCKKKRIALTFLVSFFVAFFLLIFHVQAQTEQGADGWKATRYEISVDIDPVKEFISETARIDVEASSDVYELRFKLNENLHVMDMKALKGIVDYRMGGDILIINIDPPLQGKNTLFIDLEGQIKKRKLTDRPAFMKDSIMLAWTDLWYPFTEDGWARSLIKITLPAVFKSVGPGRMVEEKQIGKNVTYTWQNNVPSSFYTLAADTRWIVRNVEKGSFRIQTCLYPPEESEFAERIVSSAAEVLNHYSELFCPYPFSQAAYVEIEGLREARTFNGFIAYPPEALIRTYSSDGFDARNPAFLWWGNVIGGRGEGGWQWIRGMGSYAEHLYCERMRLPRTDFMEKTRLEYFLLDKRLETPFSEVGSEAPAALIYGKGAGIMEMLRYTTGDERFFRAMKLLFKEKISESLAIDDLRDVIEKGADMDLDRFFHEWFDRSGAPEFSMKYKIRETYKKEFRVDIKIVQERGAYHLPVELLMMGRDTNRIEKISVDGEVNEYFFLYDFKPENVTFDPSNKIFRWRPEYEEKSLQLSMKVDVDNVIQKAFGLERDKRYDEAAQLYEEALGSSSTSREILYNYAKMEQQRKNYQKAIDLYARAQQGKPLLAREKDPLLVWSHIRKGNIYDLLGMREKALKEYRKALELPNVMDSRKTAEKYIKELYAEK